MSNRMRERQLEDLLPCFVWCFGQIYNLQHIPHVGDIGMIQQKAKKIQIHGRGFVQCLSREKCSFVNAGRKSLEQNLSCVEHWAFELSLQRRLCFVSSYNKIWKVRVFSMLYSCSENTFCTFFCIFLRCFVQMPLLGHRTDCAGPVLSCAPVGKFSQLAC